MKRSAACVLSLLLLFVSSFGAFAESTAAGLFGGTLVGIVHSAGSGGSEMLVINLSEDKDFSVMELPSPQRLVIDISDSSFPYKIQTMPINSKNIKSVRYSQFNDSTVRVVLDLNGAPACTTDKGLKQIIVHVGIAAAGTEAPAGGASAEAPAEAPEQPVIQDRGTGLADRGSADRKQVVSSGKLSIDHAASSSGDQVYISLGSSKKYNVMRLTDPERIVVDLPNMTAPVSQQQINVNGSQVKTIRYAKSDNNAARVVLDVSAQSSYTFQESKGKLALNITNSKIRNVTYHNNSDRVYLSLDGTTLTEGGEILKNLFTEKFENSGNKYTITFPSSLADIGTGKLNINDGLLNSIEIKKDANAKTTSVIFNAKSKLVYRTIARSDVKDTAINILKPASSGEKLVVIDPGHGGVDPGALYGGVKEKDINLDIALRLNNLLNQKKIKTYMTREDDRFVGLYERAYIANDLKAKLFISVHNNAIGDTNYGGTMTLFYPPRTASGFNGKSFAQLIQSKLLGSLKTTDRKIIERPNLVVLKATAMPSAIAEVAFLTNAKDRANLQSPAFRQKAAQALCDAIVQALSKVK